MPDLDGIRGRLALVNAPLDGRLLSAHHDALLQLCGTDLPALLTAVDEVAWLADLWDATPAGQPEGRAWIRAECAAEVRAALARALSAGRDRRTETLTAPVLEGEDACPRRRPVPRHQERHRC